METTKSQSGGEIDAAEEPGGAMVLSLAEYRGRARDEPAQPFLTNEERREIREMLAYYKVARPQFEAIKAGCGMARRLLASDE